MNKIISLLSGVILLTAAGSALAKTDVECPNAGLIRSKGTVISKGYMDTESNDYLWIFYSEPYPVGDGFMWQTIFEENIFGETDPSSAINRAQSDLNHLPLSTYVRSYTTSDNVTVCEYTPYKTNYKVIAVNHIDATLKK